MNLQEKLREEQKKESKETIIQFMNDTHSEEILVVVLKAHLYIERELIKLLTESIIDESIIKNTPFVQKLDLARSMGLLVRDGYGSLKKLNAIRNDYAHKIDYKFDEKTFEDLLSTLTKEDKDDFLEEYDEWEKKFYNGKIPKLNFKLQVLLNNLWFSLVVCRMYAKTSIEMRLREKELETMIKYMVK